MHGLGHPHQHDQQRRARPGDPARDHRAGPARATSPRRTPTTRQATSSSPPARRAARRPRPPSRSTCSTRSWPRFARTARRPRRPTTPRATRPTAATGSPGSRSGCVWPADTDSWSIPPTQAGTTAYDARNQRISLTTRLGSTATVATTTYDPTHNYQISAFYLPTGSGKEAQDLYTYDARHRLASITHQLCVVSSGHACSTTTPTGSSSYSYDDNDNRTTVTESSTGGTATTRNVLLRRARPAHRVQGDDGLCHVPATRPTPTTTPATG